MFLSDEGPMLETLDHTIRIGSTPTFLYFDLYMPGYAHTYPFLTHQSTYILHVRSIYMQDCGEFIGDFAGRTFHVPTRM